MIIFEDLRLYQIVVVLIALAMILLGFHKTLQRNPKQSLLKLFVRVVVWGGLGLIALFPSYADRIAEIIGIGDNISALVVIGFILAFLMIFKILSIIERIEQDISTLTRKKALDEFEKRKRE